MKAATENAISELVGLIINDTSLALGIAHEMSLKDKRQSGDANPVVSALYRIKSSAKAISDAIQKEDDHGRERP